MFISAGGSNLFMLSTHMHCQGMACWAGFVTKTTIELNTRDMFTLYMLLNIGRPAGLKFTEEATPISIRISCDILAHNFFDIYKETSTKWAIIDACA